MPKRVPQICLGHNIYLHPRLPISLDLDGWGLYSFNASPLCRTVSGLPSPPDRPVFREEFAANNRPRCGSRLMRKRGFSPSRPVAHAQSPGSAPAPNGDSSPNRACLLRPRPEQSTQAQTVAAPQIIEPRETVAFLIFSVFYYRARFSKYWRFFYETYIDS
jgi:hypothetical protein